MYTIIFNINFRIPNIHLKSGRFSPLLIKCRRLRTPVLKYKIIFRSDQLFGIHLLYFLNRAHFNNCVHVIQLTDVDNDDKNGVLCRRLHCVRDFTVCKTSLCVKLHCVWDFTVGETSLCARLHCGWDSLWGRLHCARDFTVGETSLCSLLSALR